VSKSLEKFLQKYNSEKIFKERVILIHDFFNLYYDSNFLLLNEILEKELGLVTHAGDNDAEVLLRYMLAFIFFERGNSQKGQEEFDRVLKMLPEVKDPNVKVPVYNFLAFSQSHRGNYEKAFQYAYDCIKFAENSQSKDRFWGEYTLGVLFFDLKDLDNSEKYYKIAAENFHQKNNDYGFARSETGLSSVYIQRGDLVEAEKLLHRSLKYYTDNEILSAQSRSLNDLGLISKKKEEYEKALGFFKQALHIRKELNYYQGISTTLNEIAELLLLIKNYPEAEKYLNEAKVVCEKINNRSKLYRTHFMFYQLYRKTNEPWKALEHFELYDKLKSEVVGEVANNKINELQKRTATEKAEKEAEIEKLRNVELKLAYDLIEEKNKEITDSIQYAKKIQYTLLANDELLNNNLAEHFILFKPKDIVSGDFYWATKKDNRFYMAVCDSTGHGVPGAFMSLLNTSFLNEAIMEKNISAPNEVFNYVRDKLIENISKEDQKDGMDGTLICIEGNKISYAAAYNSPSLVRNKELIELGADRIPVGKGERSQGFRLFEIEMQKDDVLYICTDGYADQFGGPRGKKFKYKQLQELLLKNHELHMKKQEEVLDEILEQWKGGLEQVDDILVVGIKI